MDSLIQSHIYHLSDGSYFITHAATLSYIHIGKQQINRAFIFFAQAWHRATILVTAASNKVITGQVIFSFFKKLGMRQ